MSKATKRRAKRQPATGDSRVESLTVAWMLSVVTTFVCEVVSVILSWYTTRINPEAVGLRTFGALLLFAAFVIGIISLLMLPVILKTRREPPPRGILVFSIVVGVAPLLLAFLEHLSG
jgi:hypothetical protein